MPHIIAIEYSESQRRQLKAEIDRLNKSGWPLSAKYDALTFGTWDKLFETAITPGLFAEREAIVVENAEALDVFPEKLSPLVEDDEADIVIILVFSTDTKSLKPIAKEQGFKISPDAANLLAESIESQEELRSEILKLGIFADGREITLTDAENLSFDEGGWAMMMLLDGVCANNPNDVARAVNHLRDEPMLPILAAITNRLRPALIISLFRGKYADEALKAAGFDPAKKNYAINKARAALKFFGADRIKMFMAESVRLSFLEKTSRAEGWQGFEAVIWNLMSKN